MDIELIYHMLETIYVKKKKGTSKISIEEYEEIFSPQWRLSENFELKQEILAQAINKNKDITEIAEYAMIEDPGFSRKR